ncbi:MAG: DUF6565 domain-containing protein [Rikenellaceae bacterium]
MKLPIPKFIFAALAAIFITSCVYNPNSYLTSFESFVEGLEQRAEITPSEYTEIKKDFLDYSETYYYKYSSELTGEQQKQVRDLKLRYYKVIGSNQLDSVVKDLESLGNQAVEYINKLLD